ncbi:MAG: hypothetical protein WC544_02260 [Patescibacteria group bacterium]
MDEKTPEPKKKRSQACCIIPTVILILIVIGFVAAIFIIEKKQADIVADRGAAEQYSEQFNASMPPDYTVASMDEETFNEKIVKLLREYDSGTSNFSEIGDSQLMKALTADESIASAQASMKFLKDYYPEGYFLVVNQVLKTYEEQPMFVNFFLRSMDEAGRLDFVVHELSHISDLSHPECTGYGYVIEDKFISIPEIDAPQGDELLKYISQSASMDEKYLKESKQKIYTTLDEINSYTKSVRVARAYIRYQTGVIDEDAPQALSRQLYYLSLHLKNIKDHHPDAWQALMRDKGFAYVMARLVSMAKTELQAAKDEGVSGSAGTDFALSIDQNLALFEQKQALFDELYAATGLVGGLENYTQPELSELGVTIEKF